MTDLQQRAAAFLVSEGCRDRWLDGDDPVCQVHGFLWPHGRQFCNGVDEKAFQILAELAEAPAPASPAAGVAAAARLLRFLAEGRAWYAANYPAGSDRTYLETQQATLNTAARILTDNTDSEVGLFLPTHMTGEWQQLLAEVGLAGPDRQTLSDVALLYRQAYPKRTVQ